MSDEMDENPEAPAPERSNWTTRLILGALIALGLAALLVQGVNEARRAAPVGQGKPAPALEGAQYGGGALKLGDLKGKVVMVDFWATWCPPCVEELPTLVKLTAEYESRGLVLVAANQIASDTRADVGLFVDSKLLKPLPANAHVIFAEDSALERYKVEVLPTLFFIDREGNVMDAYTGFAPEDTLRSRIDKALAPR